MKIIADNTIPYLKGIAEPVADVAYLDSKAFTPERIKEADWRWWNRSWTSFIRY